MLEPQDRRLLLDALRPPEGYVFDEGIGTTFTLDLLALLTAPLGFTMLELQDSRPGEIGESDALLLLKTLRRYADRLTIFCQAGRIALPRGQGRLLASLESSVVEVAAPAPGAVFHPKVWALRYVAPDDPELPVRYRVLVLTRNLTFDRSWDTMLVLDGTLQDRVNAIARNHPLGDLVKTLPDMAIRQVDPAIAARVGRLEHELRRVDFMSDLPPGITDLAFHALGLPGKPKRDPIHYAGNRILVISPFVSADRLHDIATGNENDILVSRPEELAKLSPEQLELYSEIYALSPQAMETLEGETEGDSAHLPEIGLHAKVYVSDEGRDTRIWTGSANATNAAFHRNVEFLVEMVGPRKTFGIDAVLARQEGVVGLRDLLVPWTPPDKPDIASADACAAEEALDAARLAIAGARWIARAQAVEGAFDLTLAPEQPAVLPDAVEDVRVHPIMLPESAARPVDVAVGVTFPGLTLAALTSFMGFAVRVRVGEATMEARFVVNAELRGAPEDRRESILRSLLRDRRQVLRFLMLLLADDEQVLSGDIGADTLAGGMGGETTIPGSEPTEALLETLLRTLHRHPERLEEVARLIKDLESTETAAEPLVPAGLREVFEPIFAARTERR